VNWQHKALLRLIDEAKAGDEACLSVLRHTISNYAQSFESKDVIRFAECLKEIREESIRRHIEKN